MRSDPLTFVLAAPDGVDPLRWERVAERLFWRTLAAAPRVFGATPERCARRLTIGHAALDEKIRIWNAGLDDGVVECLKLDLRLRDASLRQRPAADVRLIRVTADRLGFGISGAPGAWIPRGRYAELLAERARLCHRWPALFRGPWVDHLRLRG